jgi:hypothetical protein
MAKYSFNEIKSKMYKMTNAGWEPELTLYLYEKEYMIIGYSDHCSFQRCGVKDGSGEFDYETLDDLYNQETVDAILLSRDWNDIEDFECFDFELFYGIDF